jgi:predicted small metal-binding protein
MRAVDCPCGEYLEARNDTELLERAKEHNSSEHEGSYSEVDLRILVDTAAYDTGGNTAP